MSHTSSKTPSKASARSMRVGIVVGIIFIVVATLLIFLPAPDSQPESHGGGMPNVLIASVVKESTTLRIEALGTVRANEEARLQAKVTERVSGIFFEDGQSVSKGDLLIQLNDAEVKAQLADAESTLRERTAQIERIRSVEGSGALSRSVVDEEIARFERAQAQKALMEARLADLHVKAPFDGVLGLRDISVGSLVTPGALLVSIYELTPVKIDFTVPERYLSSLAEGMSLEARTVAYPEKVFYAKVQAISPEVDSVTRAVRVRALVSNENKLLKPGMLLNLEVKLETQPLLWIPEETLMPVGSDQYVHRLNDKNTVERVKVEIGKRDKGRVEVLEGLQEGERVITDGFGARPGQEVKVITREEAFQSSETL